jgi:hypothetical protein
MHRDIFYYLDTSILAISNIGRREYVNSIPSFSSGASNLVILYLEEM